MYDAMWAAARFGYVLVTVITTSAALAQAPPSGPGEKLITPPTQPQQNPQGANQSQTSGQPNQPPTSPLPSNVNVTVSGGIEVNSAFQTQKSDNKKDEGFYEVKITDVVIAAFTIFLVIGTFLLWDATRRLWRSAESELSELRTSIADTRAAAVRQNSDMQQSIKASQDSAAAATAQAEAMRDTFVSTHRPRIRFKHIWLTSEFWKDVKLTFELNVVNVGSTTATLHKCNFVTVIVPGEGRLPQRPPYYGTPGLLLNGHKLPSGITLSIPNASDNRILSDKENADIRERRSRLYCIGSIEYLDDAGKFRTTAFCRYLNVPEKPTSHLDIGRFKIESDSDYEYED